MMVKGVRIGLLSNFTDSHNVVLNDLILINDFGNILVSPYFRINSMSEAIKNVLLYPQHESTDLLILFYRLDFTNRVRSIKYLNKSELVNLFVFKTRFLRRSCAMTSLTNGFTKLVVAYFSAIKMFGITNEVVMYEVLTFY